MSLSCYDRFTKKKLDMMIISQANEFPTVVLYSIVWCSHVSFRNYNERCRNVDSHVRIICDSVVMDVST